MPLFHYFMLAVLNPCPASIRRLLVPYRTGSSVPATLQCGSRVHCEPCAGHTASRDFPGLAEENRPLQKSIAPSEQLMKTTYHECWGLTALRYTYAGGGRGWNPLPRQVTRPHILKANINTPFQASFPFFDFLENNWLSSSGKVTCWLSSNFAF